MNATDVFAYVDKTMIDQPGRAIVNSLIVTADRPLDAKEVVTSWDHEARAAVDDTLVYEGMKVYSRADKKVYICVNKPDTAETADQCEWRVLYDSSISPEHVIVLDTYDEAVAYAATSPSGKLIIVNNDNDNNNGFYIVVLNQLVRLDNKYTYGEEHDQDALTTKEVGGIPVGTRLGDLMDKTLGGDISRIIDKMLFAPAAPTVDLTISRSNVLLYDPHKSLTINVRPRGVVSEYGYYISDNPIVYNLCKVSADFLSPAEKDGLSLSQIANIIEQPIELDEDYITQLSESNYFEKVVLNQHTDVKTGLNPNTTYYVVAYAISEGGCGKMNGSETTDMYINSSATLETTAVDFISEPIVDDEYSADVKFTVDVNTSYNTANRAGIIFSTEQLYNITEEDLDNLYTSDLSDEDLQLIDSTGKETDFDRFIISKDTYKLHTGVNYYVYAYVVDAFDSSVSLSERIIVERDASEPGVTIVLNQVDDKIVVDAIWEAGSYTYDTKTITYRPEGSEEWIELPESGIIPVRFIDNESAPELLKYEVKAEGTFTIPKDPISSTVMTDATYTAGTGILTANKSTDDAKVTITVENTDGTFSGTPELRKDGVVLTTESGVYVDDTTEFETECTYELWITDYDGYGNTYTYKVTEVSVEPIDLVDPTGLVSFSTKNSVVPSYLAIDPNQCTTTLTSSGSYRDVVSVGEPSITVNTVEGDWNRIPFGSIVKVTIGGQGYRKDNGELVTFTSTFVGSKTTPTSTNPIINIVHDSVYNTQEDALQHPIQISRSGVYDKDIPLVVTYANNDSPVRLTINGTDNFEIDGAPFTNGSIISSGEHTLTVHTNLSNSKMMFITASIVDSVYSTKNSSDDCYFYYKYSEPVEVDHHYIIEFDNSKWGDDDVEGIIGDTDSNLFELEDGYPLYGIGHNVEVGELDTDDIMATVPQEIVESTDTAHAAYSHTYQITKNVPESRDVYWTIYLLRHGVHSGDLSNSDVVMSVNGFGDVPYPMVNMGVRKFNNDSYTLYQNPKPGASDQLSANPIFLKLK